MSSGSSYIEEAVQVETIYENVISSSSEEPPMEEWSSLVIMTPPDSPKMALYKQGLYDPGSGEICTKYITMSDSDVLNHPYYAYPSVKDPGIMNALLRPEPRKTYDYNGQELYLDLCEEMKVIPVRSFHRGLLQEVIDLKYYCVNPVGMRAMCMSLINNKYVKRLDLTCNHLNEDACYHLGQLLGESFALKELILTGCRILPECVKRLVATLSKRTMDLLDLSKNDMGDTGFQYLADQIFRGAVIKRLNISYNNLGVESAMSFATALEANNTIMNLDLSWNKLFPALGANTLIKELSESKVLKELNLSWNALTTGVALRKLLSVPTLRILDLSKNRLSSAAAKAINFKLHAATKLETLDLSCNPFSPGDAFLILNKLRMESVKLKNLLMDDVAVTKEFVVELQEVLELPYRSKTKITYGLVISAYTLSLPDMRDIVMKRIDFLTSRASKKCQLDIALYFLKEYKTRELPLILPKELFRTLRMAGAPVDNIDLFGELANAFPGPKIGKGEKTICLRSVVDYVHRLWPDKQLPPTPPPEPLPPMPKKGKKKGKKK